MSKEALKVYL